MHWENNIYLSSYRSTLNNFSSLNFSLSISLFSLGLHLFYLWWAKNCELLLFAEWSLAYQVEIFTNSIINQSININHSKDAFNMNFVNYHEDLVNECRNINACKCKTRKGALYDFDQSDVVHFFGIYKFSLFFQ